MDVLLKGVGVVFIIPQGQWFFLWLPVGKTIVQRLLAKDNPCWELTINDLEIATYVSHPYFYLLMAPLDCIAT